MRDVFLDEFADTDEEIEDEDEEAEERRLRREERRKAKAKAKAVYNPLAGPSKPKQVKFPPEPTQAGSSSSAARADYQELLDPNIDASKMAKSTLILALRRQRREQKRLARDENLRSSLRASTLKTDTDIAEKDKAAKENATRKGKRAQHETGIIRVVHKMTQDELIAAALEEEERNKEDLRDWLRKEDEKRELRRVGRKRVRGPRWTWVSRTVGRVVEEVDDDVAKMAAQRSATTPIAATPAPVDTPGNAGVDTPAETPGETPGETPAETPGQTPAETPVEPTMTLKGPAAGQGKPSDPPASARPAPAASTPSVSNPWTSAAPTQPPADDPPTENAIHNLYARNYIILSQIPGGLKSELELVLGDHVQWDNVKYIPHRNRPISE